MKFLNKLLLGVALLCVASHSFATAGPWIMHDGFKLRAYNGSNINLTADTIKMVLVTSASNFGTTSVNNYASLTNELSTANGYTNGGAVVTVTWSGTSTVTFATSGSTVWTASGGSIVARAACLYDNTDTNKTIIACSILDNTPADVTVTSGNTLTVSAGTVMTLAVNDFWIAASQGVFVPAYAANDELWAPAKIAS